MLTFLAVVQSGAFRDAARFSNGAASQLSEAVKCLECTSACAGFIPPRAAYRPLKRARAPARLRPAPAEVRPSQEVGNHLRDHLAGILRLNVPANVARTVLPAIVTPFLKRYPEIWPQVIVEDSFVDLLAAGCNAGLRYDERLAQDMITIPIGPCSQRLVTATVPGYLQAHGCPEHPGDLLQHARMRG